ncbi:type II secretion system F family protein [Neobacillus sp. LXY-4]|uniref:type II secretion system F family protein n=1 Tax=Neobacillus sp. LXY-4 TaxID=3379826 RepID=UPI003EDE8609
MLNTAFIITASAFFSLFTAGILSIVFKRKLTVNDRIEKYFNTSTYSVEKIDKDVAGKIKKQLAIFQKYWDAGEQYINKRISKSEKMKLDAMLNDAGFQYKWTAIEFRLMQLVLTLGSGLFLFLFFLPTAENKGMAWLLVISTSLLSYRLPMFYLSKKRTERIKFINRSMADFFDMVNVLLEAGMGLDGALSEVSHQTKGPLGEEFLRTLEDMKLGKSRREAFYDLRKRVPSEQFQGIMSTLIQADQLGIGMAKVLRNLTVRIREQRREAARELAMKAPVKMLFPMVFLIFPSIFIVILGPLVIQFVTNGLGL